MPTAVVVGGMIQCSHKGTAQLLSGDPRLEIAGSKAVVAGMEAGVTFAPGAPGVLAPCPFATAAGPSPCAATIKATAGVSTQLTVGGLGVILDNALGLATNPSDPSATWSVASPGQALVSVDR